MKKVLIPGGTGLVGSRLTALLRKAGYEVHILTRSKTEPLNGIYYHEWSVEGQRIDPEVLEVDHIIHLAGAGVADKRWTDRRKKEILESRTASTALLSNALRTNTHTVRSLVSASAVGYYGDRGETWLTEDARPGDGFLSEVCQEWEKAVQHLGNATSLPVARLRIGIVLSTKGGALPQLALPSHFGVGAYLGNGEQYYPWIHIDDLCRMFIFALENNLADVYNASAPEPEMNEHLAKTIAYIQKKWFVPVSAPAFLIRLGMGEMAEMVLGSQRTSSEKIVGEGFTFEFSDLETALRDIFRRKV